jgi:hypothetical protein
MTIPSFPDFGPLNPADRPHVESFTEGFPPYSDFNFTSMWIWDGGLTRVSSLDGSLVVRFSDYVTGQPFYSLTGKCASRHLRAVLDHSAEQKIASYLKLVPEHVITHALGCEGLVVQEDRDNHDYICSLKPLGSYLGSQLKAKRNSVTQFRRRGSFQADCFDLKCEENRMEVLSLFERWRLRKGLLRKDTDHELSAVRRLLEISNATLVAVGVREAGKLIACSISEVLRDRFAICHFEKADIQYEGVYAYLMQATAQQLMRRECSFLNYEQDLGIQGLRFSKSAYQPCYFLKKFRVSVDGRSAESFK